MSDVLEVRIDEDSEHGPVIEFLLYNTDEDGELLECGSCQLSLFSLKKALENIDKVQLPLNKRVKLKLKEKITE